MQILVRTVHTVQQTVDFHRYSSWDGCHAPVVVQRQVPWLGRSENCGVRSCRLSSSWTRLLCPSVQRLWVAQCLVRLWIHVLHHPGWLMEDFVPEVDSRRFSPMPKMKWPRSSTTAVACFLQVLLILLHLALSSRRLLACRHAHGDSSCT